MFLINPLGLVNNVLRLPAVLAHSLTRAVDTATPHTTEGNVDTVQVSDSARRLLRTRSLANLARELGLDAGEDGGVDGVRLLRRLRADLAAFEQELGKIFRDNGIDLSKPLELGLDEHGQVRVRNRHPDAERIEAIFRTDPELARAFKRAAAEQELAGLLAP